MLQYVQNAIDGLHHGAGVTRIDSYRQNEEKQCGHQKKNANGRRKTMNAILVRQDRQCPVRTVDWIVLNGIGFTVSDSRRHVRKKRIGKRSNVFCAVQYIVVFVHEKEGVVFSKLNVFKYIYECVIIHVQTENSNRIAGNGVPYQTAGGEKEAVRKQWRGKRIVVCVMKVGGAVSGNDGILPFFVLYNSIFYRLNFGRVF